MYKTLPSDALRFYIHKLLWLDLRLGKIMSAFLFYKKEKEMKRKEKNFTEQLKILVLEDIPGNFNTIVV